MALTRFAGFALALCLFCGLASAQSVATELAWLDLEGLAKPPLADSASVTAALAAGSAPAVGDHDFEEIVYESSIHLRDDGMVERSDLQVRRFNTTSGARLAGEFRFSVRSQFSDVTVVRAFVQRPNGRRVLVDARSVQVVTPDEPDIYSDVNSVVIPIPGAVSGAVAVLETRSVFRRSDWPLPWSTISYASFFYPVREQLLEVHWDESMNEPIWKTDSSMMSCERVEARRVRCRSGIDLIATDANVDSLWDVTSHLVFSLETSWGRLARRELELVQAMASVDEDVATEVAYVTDAATTPRERIERLHRFVADSVRYTGLEHGASAVVPHPASATLARMYGDCKDKVTLFIAMAEAAGLHAWPVLVASGIHDVDQMLVPAASYFDHMIVCMQDAEDEICIDLTASEMGTGLLPVPIQGSVALDLTPTTSAPRLLPRDAFSSVVQATNETRIECDGTIEDVTSRTFSGASSAVLRASLQELRKDDRHRVFVEEYHEVVNSAVDPNVAISGLAEPAAPIEIRSESSFQGTGDVETATRYSGADPWLRSYSLSLKTTNRTHAYRMKGMRYVAKHRLEFCDLIKVSHLGAKLDFTSKYGSLSRTYRRVAGAAIVETSLDLPSATYAEEDREKLNRFIDIVVENSEIAFDLLPAS